MTAIERTRQSGAATSKGRLLHSYTTAVSTELPQLLGPTSALCVGSKGPNSSSSDPNSKHTARAASDRRVAPCCPTPRSISLIVPEATPERRSSSGWLQPRECLSWRTRLPSISRSSANEASVTSTITLCRQEDAENPSPQHAELLQCDSSSRNNARRGCHLGGVILAARFAEFRETPPDSTIERTAAQLRATAFPTEIDAIGRALGVYLTEEPLAWPLLGLTLGPDRIVIKAGLEPPVRRFTIAHEYGHLLIQRRALPPVRPENEEPFCDRFARELLLPFSLVKAEPIAAIGDLAVLADVPNHVALAQLAASGKVPYIHRDESGRVVCGACGYRRGGPSCSCLRYRQRSHIPLPVIALPTAA